MKRIVMTIEQIQTMVAKEDGYDTREEWLEDAEEIGYWNVYSPICLIGECLNFGFCRDGVGQAVSHRSHQTVRVYGYKADRH